MKFKIGTEKDNFACRFRDQSVNLVGYAYSGEEFSSHWVCK
jgi:hypothetical protein